MFSLIYTLRSFSRKVGVFAALFFTIEPGHSAARLDHAKDDSPLPTFQDKCLLGFSPSEYM